MFIPGQPTLDNLDDVPWSSLTHAYGKAIDVPEQIRALLHDNPDKRARVLFGFTCNIFHQGSVYRATVAAIPYLIELLMYEGVEDRDQILEMLAFLAVGYPTEHYANFALEPLVAKANPLSDLEPDKNYPWRDAEDEIEDIGVMRDCYAAVAAGCPLYSELLDNENARISIAASFVLAFFPLHAYSTCPRLWNVARDERRHAHVRASAMIALSYLQGGAVRESVHSYFVGQILGLHTARGQKVPYLSAVAAYCLLRDHSWEASDESRKHLAQIIEVCLETGIESVPCDFYRSREIRTAPIESGEDYYETLLKPQAHFPWHIETAIKHHVRQNLQSSAKEDTALANANFHLDSLLTKLAQAGEPDRAESVSRMLLDYAFGEKHSSTHAESSERQFPIETWDETQRRIVTAIAACDAAWPGIAYSMNMSLQIDFEPNQSELKEALRAVSSTNKSFSCAAQSELTVQLPDLSDEGVRAAVVALFECFVRSKGIEQELKKFAPFRPYAGVAIDFLIGKLDATALKERQAAAWALGRIGEFARSAAPVLFRKMQEDPENQYCSLVLSETGVDQPLSEKVCDLVEKTEDFGHFHIVRSTITNERLHCWLNHPSGKIRYLAVAHLGERIPSQMRFALLRALDDPDENVVREAQRILAQPAAETGAWYFTDFHELTTRQRKVVAEGFASRRTELSRYRSGLFRLLQTENDGELLDYLQAICWFKEKTPTDLEFLVSVQDRFASPSWRIQLIRTMRRLQGNGFNDKLVETLSDFLTDPDPWVRTEAVERIGCFKNVAKLAEALFRALTDPSPLVQCKAVWSAFYRGQQMHHALFQLVESDCNDRVAAEAIWALSMSIEGKRFLRALSRADEAVRPMTSSAQKWAEQSNS